MPRRRPLEAAVSHSPLFRLSPEIRTMIYTLLLTTPELISLPKNLFKRRRNQYYDIPPPTRRGTHEISRSQIIEEERRAKRSRTSYRGPPNKLIPAILRACRLVYQETCPILYRCNAFDFVDSAMANDFRWRTDAKHAAWVEEISITIESHLLPSCGERWGKYLRGSLPGWDQSYAQWCQYLRGKSRDFKEDYPHIKRMTITLGNNSGALEVAGADDLRTVCENIARHIRGLDWVYVIGLNNESIAGIFKPMVEKEESSQDGKKGVQTDVTEFVTEVGWKNVTLWWGPEDGKPPFKPNQPSDLRNRRALFKIWNGPMTAFGMGASWIPEAPH